MEQTPAEPAEPPVRLSRWSRVALIVIGVLIGAVTTVQTAAVMLVSGPSNTITTRYGAELSGWTQPWFAQDWQLFGPNPQSANNEILVRARTQDGAVGPWVDLTAEDYAAIEHDPIPSQGNTNELRRAWQEYRNLAADSPLTQTVQSYLANIALQRLLAQGYAGGASTFAAVEFDYANVAIPAPGSTLAVHTDMRTLPWWTITNQSQGPNQSQSGDAI